jgi:type I restriction-modification system DNA methylase subunit
LALQGGAIKDDAVKTKGYFIYPSQLFCNVVAKANNNENLNTDLATIFPTKQPALRLSRTKNLHFAKATFPGFSAVAWGCPKQAFAKIATPRIFSTP